MLFSNVLTSYYELNGVAGTLNKRIWNHLKRVCVRIKMKLVLFLTIKPSGIHYIESTDLQPMIVVFIEGEIINKNKITCLLSNLIQPHLFI